MNNNTPDPVALAREVLDAVKVMDATPGTLYLDGPTHEHEKAASSILDAAPDLARAVIDLTDKAERMEALAANLDAAAAWKVLEAGKRDLMRAGWVAAWMTLQNDPDLIHCDPSTAFNTAFDALNGRTR